MAYAAVISLKNTIERLLNSSTVSFDVAPFQEILKHAYKELNYLQQTLKRLDFSRKSSCRTKVNALDEQIREAVSQFEDKLEYSISDQFISQYEESSSVDKNHSLLVPVDLQDLRHDFHSFMEMAKRMKEEYADLLITMPEFKDVGVGEDRPNTKMIGFSDIFDLIKYGIVGEDKFSILSIIGMAGIGKTTLVNEIFEDKTVISNFECRAWLKVGRKFQLDKIARDILSQLGNPVMDEKLAEEDIAFFFKEIFKKRCLIVLDDVWDKRVWDYLLNYFPRDGRSQTLLTTRLLEVAIGTYKSNMDSYKQMRFLNKHESWDLLREKVFGEDSCPLKLEKAGKKIAENCDGLPLLIVRIAGHLSKGEMTVEYWNKVAEKQNSVFVDAYDQILEVLYPSYEYLHQHLKPCFLYMGVFPQNYNVPRSRLINMWISEGIFLEPSMLENSEYHAMNYLDELISNSLVIFTEASCYWFNGKADNMKTFSLHSTLWFLANKIAKTIKFFHVLSSRLDGLEEDIKSQRRLCNRSGILFGIKGVFNSMENDCASIARSLLCFGPYHQYPVPIYFNFRLLRVLDALVIRFYDFPIKVLQLFQLRYLALTYNGNLPSSISKLSALQFMIIRRHMSIQSSGAASYSYVPLEIWDLQELKHIEVMESNLPRSNGGVSLKNLSTLLGVSVYTLTKGVIRRIPNLKKLGIEIKLLSDGDSAPFHFLNRISRLRKLESLKCVVVNPEMRSDVVPPPPPRSMFPSTLIKLTLSGLGYPWEYMSVIAKLENLCVLKLQCYAFQGPKWEITEDEPLGVGLLQMEDTDLVELKVAPGGLPYLRRLSIKHCYNFEQLNWEPDNYIIRKIEVVDCTPSLIARVKQIEEAQLARRYPYLGISLHSSWDDGNLQPTVERKRTFWQRVNLEE